MLQHTCASKCSDSEHRVPAGGWTAHADKTAALYFAYDGKKQLDGEVCPFFFVCTCACVHAYVCDAVSEVVFQVTPYTTTEVKRMDRVGLLVDMDREVFEIMINDESQGVLTEKLPRPMFFVVDMGWYQPFRSVRLLLWRVRSRLSFLTYFCP